MLLKFFESVQQLIFTRRLAVIVLLVTLIGLTLLAQVPGQQQAALFSRILAYDRNLRARSGAQVTVGIVFKADNGASRAASEEMLSSFTPLKARTIQNLPFDVTSHAYADSARLNEWIGARDIDVIYICPGLDASFGEIASVAASRRVATLTPDRREVQRGATIGVILKEGKPGIVVNLTSARALGMDLDPKLLQLAEVIR